MGRVILDRRSFRPGLSPGALVGLAHATVMDESLSGNHPEGIVRRTDEESGDVLPFDGGPAERALRTQTVQV
jgi:hypothetical protein